MIEKTALFVLQSGGTEAMEASMVSDFACQYHHRNMQGTWLLVEHAGLIH